MGTPVRPEPDLREEPEVRGLEPGEPDRGTLRLLSPAARIAGSVREYGEDAGSRPGPFADRRTLIKLRAEWRTCVIVAPIPP